MKSLALGVAVGSVLMIAAGIGAVLGLTAADRSDDVARLEASAAAWESRAERAEDERARLRIERNRLEAQLAAEEAPPVCPKPFVSTDTLITFASFEYPCGWHVLHNIRPGVDDIPDDGMLVVLTLLSQLPVSLAPDDDLTLAEIELADWVDDPSIDGDGLPPLAEWVADERERFVSEPETARFEAGGSITMTRLTGTQAAPWVAEDATTTVDVVLWEFTDLVGGRHVMRAVAIAPSSRTAATLDRVARSFEVAGR